MTKSLCLIAQALCFYFTGDEYMEEYKKNSHNAKERLVNGIPENKPKADTPRIRKMVGQNDIVKKSGFRKLADVFISEDIGNVKSYLFESVIVPTLKNLFVDFVTNGANMLVNGEARSSRAGSNSRTSYDRYYSSNRRDDDRSVRPTRRWGFEDYIIVDRRKAEDILKELDGIIEEFHQVRVADLNEMLGVSGPYTEQYYGWTDIRSAKIVPVRGGYIIDMPRVQALN